MLKSDKRQTAELRKPFIHIEARETAAPQSLPT